MIDSVDDKARTLVQSSSDPQLANFVSQTGSRYEKLCRNAKVSSGHLLRLNLHLKTFCFFSEYLLMNLGSGGAVLT